MVGNSIRVARQDPVFPEALKEARELVTKGDVPHRAARTISHQYELDEENFILLLKALGVVSI